MEARITVCIEHNSNEEKTLVRNQLVTFDELGEFKLNDLLEQVHNQGYNLRGKLVSYFSVRDQVEVLVGRFPVSESHKVKSGDVRLDGVFLVKLAGGSSIYTSQNLAGESLRDILSPSNRKVLRTYGTQEKQNDSSFTFMYESSPSEPNIKRVQSMQVSCPVTCAGTPQKKMESNYMKQKSNNWSNQGAHNELPSPMIHISNKSNDCDNEHTSSSDFNMNSSV